MGSCSRDSPLADLPFIGSCGNQKVARNLSSAPSVLRLFRITHAARDSWSRDSKLGPHPSWHAGFFSSSNEFDIQRDGNLISDQKTARFQGGIPVEPEVFSIDSCAGRNTNAHVSVRILVRFGGPLDFENYFAGHSPKAEFAGHK